MVTNEILYRTLMRTAALARRMPMGGVDVEAKPEKLPWGRGFGHILDLLSREEGICQQQIAQLAGIRPQSVSEAIGILEGRGLVRREAGENDKRMILIYLTESGEAHRKKAAEERRYKAGRLFEGLNEEEKETLYGLLQKLQTAESEKEKGDCK